MADQPPWEPDPRMMGNWTAMFDQPRRDGTPRPEAARPQTVTFDDALVDDAGGDADPSQYRPWTVQRGATRPVMMLHLRRFEPRSGMWQGWALSYPTLTAVEYVGPRMISLDFGTRQFMIEGDGLDGLVDRLQLGSVTVIQEYNAATWPTRAQGPVVTAIKSIGDKLPTS